MAGSVFSFTEDGIQEATDDLKYGCHPCFVGCSDAKAGILRATISADVCWAYHRQLYYLPNDAEPLDVPTQRTSLAVSRRA
jgi:hypothetical protein